MKAMILAGGMSTRLYPLTKRVPKPLVPLVGVPNAVHVIRYLAAYGFDEIAINVHYLAETIIAELGDGSAHDVRLTYLHERELTGSAGAVKQMEAFFSGPPFVVIGCDEATNLPLDRLLAFHREKAALATIGLARCDEVDQYGVVITDDDGRIVEFQEKPPKGTERSKLVNTGIYVFSPAIFAHMPPAGEFYDFGKQLFPTLQREQRAFFGYESIGAYWSDIGTPSEYRRTTNDVLTGVFAIPGARAVEDDVWIGATASIADGAHVIGPSVIGEGVCVARNATVERSILWKGASVGENAVVRDTIVGIDYAVAPGARFDGDIVALES